MLDRRTYTKKIGCYKRLDWYVIKVANYSGFTYQHCLGWGGEEGGRREAPLPSFKKNRESSLDNEQIYII
jgi:hypothetical protein